MAKVEFIYFAGCPNIELARERLHDAFAVAGLTPQWIEWDRNEVASPAHTRGWGSPTILVNGEDVTGGAPDHDETSSCRLYVQSSGKFDGAPSVESIVDALRADQRK